MRDDNDLVYDTYGVDLVALLEGIAAFIRGFFGFDDLAGEPGASVFLAFLSTLWNVYSVIAVFLALLFFTGFVYAKIRLAQLAEVESRLFHEAEKTWEHMYGGALVKNDRWSDVQKHLSSASPNDWRLAIIEADIMLEETLDRAGFRGASIGEKLKDANPASFKTLQDAWDAHKIRNDIAHRGGDFVLTQRIAQEAIVKYERVFREFNAL